MHDLAAAQRLLAVVARQGLDTDHLAVGRQGTGCQRAASQQAATAQADEQGVQLAHFLDQLLGGRALAGDDVGMVVRRHQGQAALLCDPLAQRLAVFGETVVHDDLGTVAAGGGHLAGGCVLRHQHHGGHVEDLRGQGNRLGMVARRKSEHAPLALRRGEGAQGIKSAPELERAGALQVLALEEQCATQQCVGRAGTHDRGVQRVALQAVGGGLHILEGG